MLLVRIRNGNNGGEGETDRTMKLIYHAPLFSVGQEMLRAPVYIWKRNAVRKTGSLLPFPSFIWILRAVNESRPIKFLFQVGCWGVITRARYAISAASFLPPPPLSNSPYYTVDT